MPSDRQLIPTVKALAKYQKSMQRLKSQRGSLESRIKTLEKSFRQLIDVLSRPNIQESISMFLSEVGTAVDQSELDLNRIDLSSSDSDKELADIASTTRMSKQRVKIYVIYAKLLEAPLSGVADFNEMITGLTKNHESVIAIERKAALLPRKEKKKLRHEAQASAFSTIMGLAAVFGNLTAPPGLQPMSYLLGGGLFAAGANDFSKSIWRLVRARND